MSKIKNDKSKYVTRTSIANPAHKKKYSQLVHSIQGDNKEKRIGTSWYFQKPSKTLTKSNSNDT